MHNLTHILQHRPSQAQLDNTSLVMMSRPNHKVPDTSNHPPNLLLLDNTNQVLQEEPNHVPLAINPRASFHPSLLFRTHHPDRDPPTSHLIILNLSFRRLLWLLAEAT